MEFTLVLLLNGISYGLLLFMLSSGLTVIFGMLGVLNFAHASFYMLGAYFAASLTALAGFWVGLLVAPPLVGLLGALFERFCLRRVRSSGHAAELLVTFGLAYIVLELVQLGWGRGVVDYRVPAMLDGPLFTLAGNRFALYRGFMMLVALTMLLFIWLLLVRTRFGLVLRAAVTHPQALEALGHNVPRVFTLVFGTGCALAALAGVVGGNTYVTEPDMALSMGGVVFVVVVVGGMGSLAGALLASLLIGVLQTFAVAVDGSVLSALGAAGVAISPDTPGYVFWKLKLSQLAPILPYLLLVLMLIFRPRGLLGPREV